MKKISLSGIKPTGTPHLGNYLGMIRPALELAQDHEAFYFIADAHALNQLHDGGELRRRTMEAAATLLALGLNPDAVTFFRQSDIPEVFELALILAASAAKGLLNRAHAYKAAVDANLAAGRDPDAGVNMGLFTYPILMAADILLFGADVVPVGEDNRQHVEIAADIARAFNHSYGGVFTVPEAVIRRDVASVPGTDGRKMSKGYDNVLPIFAPSAELRKRVMGIVTDSRRPEEPGNPGENVLFGIYRLVATPAEADSMRKKYLGGGFTYGEVKQALYEALERTFGGARTAYERCIRDPADLERTLRAGARKARSSCAPLMNRVRDAVGFHPEGSAHPAGVGS
jgi:tryptophanyl-tRNA synthetase